jgi:hypothetical protein
MADWVTCEVNGLDELQKKLNDMATKDAKAIVKDGLKEGAAVMRSEIAATGSAAPGEIGSALSTIKSWSVRVRMRAQELAGTATIGVKGSLPEVHTASHSAIQPRGKRYHRSLNYLIKLLEFGASQGEYKGRRMPVMSAGFESGRSKTLQAITDTIKRRLGL